MRLSVLAIFVIFIVSIGLGQDNSKTVIKYKPANLDEAVYQLGKIHHDTIKQKILAMTEKEFVSSAHMGIGMWMRNNWGLWKDGELAQYFKSIGIFHPDDMSGIILTSYYRDLQGQDRELDKQVKLYQDYWKATEEHFRKLETDTVYRNQIKARQDSLKREYLNKKKNDWKPGTIISGYLDYSCGFFGSGERTKIKGEIISWEGEKILLKITHYFDEKKKKKVLKCNDIKDDLIIIEDHEYYKVEE